MVSKRCIKSSQELRFEAVTLHKHHPDWSFRAIGKKMHCSHQFVSRWIARHRESGHVKDQPRPGRPHKADAAAVQHISMAAKLPECFTTNDIAQQDLGLKLSISTVERVLRRQGLTHLSLQVATFVDRTAQP